MNRKITYRPQHTRCGKQRCRKCKEGAGHGPYWYAYWSENGRTISKYIGINPPAEIVAKEGMQENASLQLSGIKPAVVLAKNEDIAAVEEKQRIAVPSREIASPQPLLRIYLLGQFRIERKEGDEWQTIANRTWQRRRARALLGCLLSQNGRRMGREQVMEALWPDQDIEIAANRLNGAVHELRQILEPEIARPAASKMLRLERDILILADPLQIWVDAETFEGLLNKANATKDAAQTEQILEQAAALYEGDYLLEELYSEWPSARRESLRRSWMGLLLELAELRAGRDALTSAIEPLDRLLTADPTHETAVRRLMLLLTQLDRRGEAIRAYKRLATILKRDFESDPLPETVELYKALRQGHIQAPPPRLALPARDTQSRRIEKKSASQPESLSPLNDADTNDSPLWQILPHSIFPLGRQNQSPLIGRERELETMRHMMLVIDSLKLESSSKENKQTRPRESGANVAHFVMLMGETGIGKTRLAEELSQEAHTRGWLVAWTRAYEQEGTIPYRPWTDILRTLLQNVPLEQITSMLEGKAGQATNETSSLLNPAATAQARLQRLSSLLPELAPDVNRPQTPIAPEQERFHLWEAMLALLSGFSQVIPLLLVLDDLHWTDDSSLELLAYLARHLQNMQIMLIGTCRDMELGPVASLRTLLNDLRREQVLITLPVQSLSQPQIGQLIAHLPRDLVSTIQNQAGGNPLFAEELARFSEISPGEGLRESNTSYYLAGTDDIVHNLKSANRSTALPETIAAVLERRLNKLSSECQTLLSKAAVLGGSFEFLLLTYMTGEAGNEDTTLDLLEEALRSGLLTEEVSGTRIVYHFWHPLIVSHLYERLSAARRAQLHRRAALALIEILTENKAERAAAIAHHLSKNGQEKQKLIYYAEIAGNQAIALSAYPEALHYYRQALEALQSLKTPIPAEPQDPMHIANLLECMAECNAMLGNYQDARQQYEQVLDLHNKQTIDASIYDNSDAFLVWQQEEAQVQGMIWRAIGRIWRIWGDYSQAHECVKHGKDALHSANITNGTAWASLQHLDGTIYWADGNFPEARKHIQESLETHEEAMRKLQNQERESEKPVAKTDMHAPLITHSRRTLLGDPFEMGRAWESLGVVAACMAQYTEALQHLYKALSIFEKHDMIGVIVQVCGNIGAVFSMRAEYTVANSYFKRALELTERTGDIPSKALVTGNLGDVAAHLGNLPEAEEWLLTSLALAEQISDRDHTCWCLATLTTIQQDLGKERQALESVRRALALGQKMKSTVRVGFALIALANWRVSQTIIRGSFFPGQPTNNLIPENHKSQIWSARAAVKRALALEGIEAETQRTGEIVLARISYHLGDLAEAQQQAMSALEETQQSGMIHLMGRAQRLLGDILVARGSAQEADSYFEQALATFKGHGLRLDYARTLIHYGFSLLQRDQQAVADPAKRAAILNNNTYYQTGINALREARDILELSRASIDLRWVEQMLAHLTLSQVSS
jgi:DNA-binding SARP family transcriptional activator/predicted negative regulator of RcsB-dependent stress response